jgi:hypothetical protein
MVHRLVCLRRVPTLTGFAWRPVHLDDDRRLSTFGADGIVGGLAPLAGIDH